MAVALLDYNMGNLGSVRKALEFVGAGVEVVESGAGLAKFGCCILPGVGNFGDGMENLKQRGFDRAIPEFLARGGYFFGVCLGMQMLFEESDEVPRRSRRPERRDSAFFRAPSCVSRPGGRRSRTWAGIRCRSGRTPRSEPECRRGAVSISSTPTMCR